jgi:hypothetical protein
MKKNPSSSDFDIQDWAQRLEAGRTDDPELVLAQRLSALCEQSVGLDAAFRSNLRSRLLQDDRWHRRPFVGQLASLPGAVRWLWLSVAAVFVVVIILLAWPRGVQGVSAAEIMRQARIGASSPAIGSVIYDRLRLSWTMKDARVENVLGEIWYAPGSRVYRYQLTSSTGELLFYQAYDGADTTQSVHNQRVGEQPVEQVYRFKGFVPLGLDRPGDGGLLANPSPVSFWLQAVQQDLGRQSDCSDLFCLLGLAEDGWDCAGSRCKFSFGEVEGIGITELELVLKGRVQLEDGHQVYEIRLLPAGALLQYLTGFGTVYLDVETYQIVRVEYSMKSILLPVAMEMSVEHLERRQVNPSDLPADFFRTPPRGVGLVEWAGNLRKFLDSQFGYHENRVWVISTDPPSGSSISGEVTFNMELGYQLTGLPYASLHSTLWGVGKDTGAGGASIPVQAGEGVVHLRFTLDTDELEEGAWALGADLGIYTDAGSRIAINDLMLFDIQWCVRCDPAILPTQPAVLGTYWRPLVVVVTSGQVAEGYVLKSIQVSPTHVLLHRAGRYAETDLPQQVETETINLQGLTQPQVVKAQLVLPENGEMIGAAIVEVTIEIEPVSP